MNVRYDTPVCLLTPVTARRRRGTSQMPSRIGLTTRRNIAVANDSIVPDIGVMLCQGRQQLIQGVVLSIGIRLVITTLEFDTDTEVIALLAPQPAGDTRVPSPRIR